MQCGRLVEAYKGGVLMGRNCGFGGFGNGFGGGGIIIIIIIILLLFGFDDTDFTT